MKSPFTCYKQSVLSYTHTSVDQPCIKTSCILSLIECPHPFFAHYPTMAEKYLLRVTAGPSYDPSTHEEVAVNGPTSTRISSPYCTANINIRIQNYRGKLCTFVATDRYSPAQRSASWLSNNFPIFLLSSSHSRSI